MKKLFIALVIAAAFTACNDTPQTTESSTSDSAASVAPMDTLSTDTSSTMMDSTAVKVDSSSVR